MDDQKTRCQCMVCPCDDWSYRYYGAYEILGEKMWLCFKCADDCLGGN